MIKSQMNFALGSNNFALGSNAIGIAFCISLLIFQQTNYIK